jgi:DNA-binding response OmpR family regulator
MIETLISPACEPASTPLQAQTNPPHRILVVEDDADIRRLNADVLSGAGYEVDAAADGAAAWNNLHSNDYDLLVTDNNMPKLTGFELLQKLRAARMIMPVIMATGTLPRQDFSASPWMQPEATLLKPYTTEELLHLVKKVLREADPIAFRSPPDMEANERTRATPTAATTANPPPSPRPAPLRILVVDEDHDLRQMYSESLTGLGYQVDGAEDGLAGWRALQANRYQLLITEHELPKLTGAELVTKLRGARMAIPVVMAANRLPTHELARNPMLQLAALLTKPFAVDALLATVKQVLHGTRPTFVWNYVARVWAGSLHGPGPAVPIARTRNQ